MDHPYAVKEVWSFMMIACCRDLSLASRSPAQGVTFVSFIPYHYITFITLLDNETK